MGDLLRTGLAWLEQMRRDHLASEVAYRRAGQPDRIVRATLGRTEFQVADDYGATLRTHVSDFLIRADELGLEPEAGDVIVANGRQYEVMVLAGEGCWRWSDPYRGTYRIHTKDIGASDA